VRAVEEDVLQCLLCEDQPLLVISSKQAMNHLYKKHGQMERFGWTCMKDISKAAKGRPHDACFYRSYMEQFPPGQPNPPP